MPSHHQFRGTIDKTLIDNPTGIKPANNPDYVPLVQTAGPASKLHVGIRYQMVIFKM
jgi:hypothetical protein